MMKILNLFLFTLLIFVTNCGLAATPLVEFTQVPNPTQFVVPGQTNLIFFTLRNNTPKDFPLSFKISSPLATVSAIGNTCDSHIAAHSSCVFTVSFTAPAQSQLIPVLISVFYCGRAPLVSEIIYNVNSNIACRLLPIDSFQTQFCQTEYQNAVALSTTLFNPLNINPIEGQAPGGMIGIYERSGITDLKCFISCGVRQLGGPPPDITTMFEIASDTKTFTTSILGKKVFESSVNPETSVNPFLPTTVWNGQSYNLNNNEKPVTFQDLATFAGGVCFSDAPSVNIFNPNRTVNQGNFVKDINLLDPASATCPGGGQNVRSEYPGQLLPTHNFYSNSSVGLLAQVLMNIDNYTQMDENDFNGWYCQHILTPLNMPSTNVCLPSEAATCNDTGAHCNKALWPTLQYSTGYRVINGTFVAGAPFPFVPWAGAGDIRSNIQDMVTFVQANVGFTTSVLPGAAEIISGMQVAHVTRNYLPAPVGVKPRENIGSQAPLVGGQGYAWVCEPTSTSPDAICNKDGSHDNYRSAVCFSKSKQLGVVVLANGGTTDHSNGLAPTVTSPGDICVGLVREG